MPDEFPQEIKDVFTKDINSLKNLLDTLSKEINEIEKVRSLEFVIPLTTLAWIEDSIRVMKKDLQDWKNQEVTEYEEFP